MKKYRLSSLVGLYLNYVFQKSTLIILGISLVLMSLIVFSLTTINNEAGYLLSYNDIHIEYFKKALLVVHIFNNVIIATLVINLAINSISFDSLFLSYVPRNIICISKIIAISLIIFGLTLFEVSLIYFVPLIKFSLYKTSASDLMLILYLFLANLFVIMIEMLFTTIFQSIFVPMIVLFLSVALKILCDSIKSLKDSLSYFIPLIDFKNNQYYLDGGIMASVVIILLGALYLSFYNSRDLKIM